ncbi:putative nitrogen regulatory protein P-II [Candidatus Nitrososphaera gargensis Ga9.2]|uniref:Putative nitrogen regulatory protein P-II n=2 Tax=Candidatus Nitrososphaera gargensis TaxID=497727 RepID=K0ILU1_NITGG|nr:putative nitrogen regulatory protein P-II [Candidatus Nitrososphaera gargensis Ga9.2]
MLVNGMKRLDLIIPHERLTDINELLHKHKVGGMTFYDIKGRGRAKREPVSVGRGVMRYVPEFGFRTKIEVLVPDDKAKAIIDDVLKVISTGSASDGKIFVYDVAEAYDIGSKEKGDAAL